MVAAADTDDMTSLPAPILRRLVQSMPKAELHLHLDGSIRPATALELAASRRVHGPATFAAMSAALIAPARCGSQAELLRAFDLPIALLQDAEAVERVARELVEAKAADGVRYVEIRWAPALHVRRGMTIEDGIAAACRGVEAGTARTGIVARLICTAMRSHEPAMNIVLAEQAAGFRERGLVGFDLAGPEEAYPDVTRHAAAFDAARDAGLHITVHAGEWGGADQVRNALLVGPERIAHGPGAIDDPGLVRELASRGVGLDLCPTSNVQAGIVAELSDHPIARLHRGGVPVTLSSDDLTVSDVTLSEEFERAVREIGLTLPELWAINRNGLEMGFGEPAARALVRPAFDAWEALVPEVRGRAGRAPD